VAIVSDAGGVTEEFSAVEAIFGELSGTVLAEFSVAVAPAPEDASRAGLEVD
jgi:hypothetical protein